MKGYILEAKEIELEVLVGEDFEYYNEEVLEENVFKDRLRDAIETYFNNNILSRVEEEDLLEVVDMSKYDYISTFESSIDLFVDIEELSELLAYYVFSKIVDEEDRF